MKKVKQSKKRWAWTEAQRRSYWSLTHNGWRRGPDRNFIIDYHNTNRAYERDTLNKILSGYLEIDTYIGYKHHPSSAKWDWR
tara:strand:- start:170 stop:415 length:246 start_codon:yes stop_codon:yes gene_type:complete